MQKLLGVLALMAGVIFPMVMVGWLAFRMNKKPRLAPDRVGLLLAFNMILPVGLVLLGLGLLSPEFGAHPWVRLGWMMALGASTAILVVMLIRRSGTTTG